ncbi:MAG: tetratricopeptide repeat protein [Alphaproteobacteria bacterium]|nr:tetratricopeptide repeat protein [Alphaproteobacteria bacterium]
MRSKKPSEPAQQTEGTQSPAIHSGGDTTINYGLTPALQDALAKEIESKSLALAEKEELVAKQAQTIRKLQASLNNRPADQSLAVEAKAKLDEGDLDEARGLLEQSFKSNKLKATEKAEQAAADAFELAKLHEAQLEYYEAQAWHERAVKLAPTNTVYLNEAGLNAQVIGQNKLAIAHLEKALERLISANGDEHPHVASIRNNLGGVWQDLGDPLKAIGYVEKALESDLKTYGENHPKIAIRWNNLGGAWQDLGEPQKALEYYERALESDLKTYGTSHPIVAIRWNNLGSTWSALGEPLKAIEYFEKSLENGLNTYGEGHPKVAIRRNNLGSVWNELGEPKKAIEYFEKALKSDLKTYGENHADVAIDLNNLGRTWQDLGEPKKAIEYYEKALSTALTCWGENHPNTQVIQNNLDACKASL